MSMRQPTFHSLRQTRVSSPILALLALILTLLSFPALAFKPIGTGGMESSINRQGSDYKNFVPQVNDPAACRNACQAESRCRAWTFVRPYTVQGPSPRCWLKYAVPPASRNNCCVSGVKSYQPAPSPSQGRSQAECQARYCPQCRNSVNLLGRAVDPGCERCLRAQAQNIRNCVAGGGGGGSGAASGNRGYGAPTQSRECYVASSYDRPPRYAVACNGGDGPAVWKLGKAGYNHVEIGPTSWDNCQRYMRSKGQRGW